MNTDSGSEWQNKCIWSCSSVLEQLATETESATTTGATASIEDTEGLITGHARTSLRYSHRHGYDLAHPTMSSMYWHTATVPPPIKEGEDIIFTPNDRDMFDQYHFSDTAGNNTSIPIIGGGACY